jgi:hypothetical protein
VPLSVQRLGYELKDHGFEVRFSADQIILLSTASGPLLGPTNLLSNESRAIPIIRLVFGTDAEWLVTRINFFRYYTYKV